MLILGIESSCDETAASVARDHTEILSNVVSSQVEEHKQYGGVVPEIASRRHCENMLPVVQKALDDAGVILAELDGIAVTAYARAISPHSTPPAPVTTTTFPVKSTFKGNFIIVFSLLTLIDMGEPRGSASGLRKGLRPLTLSRD